MSRVSFIRRAFPVPRILTLSNVSIAVSDGALAFFEVSRSGDKVRPKAYGTLPFPHIRIGDDKDEKSMGEAVTALKAFASARGHRAVRAIVHEGDVYAFKLALPTIVESELRPAIESALEENVPIPPSEALFEYDIVSVDRARRQTVVAVSVLSERVVSEYLRLLESGALSPISFETESRALARALVSPDDRDVHAVLSIQNHHSVVFVVENAKVVFSSSIDVGSSDLERAVAKTFNVSPEDAHALVSGAPAKNQPDDAALFESMLSVFATMRDELGKVIVYFKAEASKRGPSDGAEEPTQDIADIILSGSAARVPGLLRYISLSSKIPARVGSVWTNILSPSKELPDLDERSSLNYGSLIGAEL